MNRIREQAVSQRKFLSKQLIVRSWKDVEPYFLELLAMPIADAVELDGWLSRRSELDSVLEEEKAWLFIRQSCHTDNAEYARAFSDYIGDIEEQYSLVTHRLNQKLLSICHTVTCPDRYEIFIRTIRKQTEIFREKNVKIQTELEIEEQQYGAITGSMTIIVSGKELTLQQAQNHLKSNNRTTRKQIFESIWQRRSLDYTKLNDLLTSLLEKRQRMAVNAGFDNYLGYRFSQLGRFDYTLKECGEFHQSVRQTIMPLLRQIQHSRREKLSLDLLMPYDLDVDAEGKPPIQPFRTTKELTGKSILCLSEIDPLFGEFIRIMDAGGYLDLDSRKGKAPGGYNYPLHESNVPFIFMNATNNLRDLETMMHECGHAIHTFLCKDLDLVYYKEFPAEIAEVASMAMELISMEYWHHFIPDREELRRARISQLESILQVLPWIATIDKFQQWLYLNPGHSVPDRLDAWARIEGEFSTGLVTWKGYEEHQKNMWQKQIHIYQFPLYYIEYGIAQLGAIAIWKNYKENPRETIHSYKSALSRGYSMTLPELYKLAGIQFDFSPDYIRTLGSFVQNEINAI
jgi:oligoendopeptidase F